MDPSMVVETLGEVMGPGMKDEAMGLEVLGESKGPGERNDVCRHKDGSEVPNGVASQQRWAGHREGLESRPWTP